ncbi:XRE family transcriptional regulator [Glutamicibacter sp. JL.03c]|uniref:helix-turn-helix domain-containing protein n=1 Tax=Glutamicibacter sp. JL.03c TaxID=2984842 RepID=UPI0021F71D2D|nr:XRE family transcriptional regulator [Glutamicibacter sp. JL.03c]UYQ77262.1 XRE family transcriptional regulator [Glutamicibacter sp. JL.03c]
METSAEQLARSIGARVKSERKNNGWTLDQLSELAGISRRMLVNVEQGTANPSVSILLRLSDALGVGLPALVEPPEPRTTSLTRAGEGATLWTGDNGGQGILVAGTEAPDVVELWDWTMAAGERHESEAHSAGTRELLHLHQGSLTVHVGGQSHQLQAGDALSFFSDVDHSYENQGQISATFSLCVYEPGVGHGHKKEHSDAT